MSRKETRGLSMRALLVCIGAVACAHSATNRLETGEDLSRALTEARRELDRGRLECAFVRVEDARRNTAEPAFVVAFDHVFLGKPALDPSKPGDAAAIHIARSEYAEAEPLLRRDIAARPDVIAPVLALARIFELRGDSAGSSKLVAEFLRAHPTSTIAIIHTAGELPVPQRVAALEAAVADHPTDGELVFELAAAVQAAGDLDRATQLFEH